jgi:hypothetical protein
LQFLQNFMGQFCTIHDAIGGLSWVIDWSEPEVSALLLSVCLWSIPFALTGWWFLAMLPNARQLISQFTQLVLLCGGWIVVLAGWESVGYVMSHICSKLRFLLIGGTLLGPRVMAVVERKFSFK